MWKNVSSRLVGMVVLLLISIVGCTAVDSTEHCVETRYGNVTKERMPNGLNATVFVSATCFPLIEQNFPEGGNTETIAAQTSDPVTVEGDVAIVFVYNPSTVFELFKEKRSHEAARSEILNGLREGYRNALAAWSIAEIYSEQRAFLSDSVKAHVQRKLGDRAQVRTVFVRDLRAPPQIEAARVNATKQAQVLDQARKQAQIDSVNAAAKLWTARAEAEATQLRATVYERSPKLIELEIAKEYAKLCGQATSCTLGNSIMEHIWKGGSPR